MERVKDYAAFVGWFAGLGYIVLWPLTANDLGGQPFGATIFCRDALPALLELLCNSAYPLHLPPGLHALGFLSAAFVILRLLGSALRRSRRRAPAPAENSPQQQSAMPRQSFKRPLRSVKPRSHFGLRGAPNLWHKAR
ncbi:MAG: hypothetical protein ABI830_00940 [Pseudolabrys sp.]